MFLKHLSLQNFRNYSKSEFDFDKETTLIVGPNTSGKTNLLEAIFLLSSGRSFRAEKDSQMIQFGKDIARVGGEVGDTKLEVVLTNQAVKKYLINNVSKRRVDFAGNLGTVLFSPVDLDIIVDSPGVRRDFLDSILEQVDREYRTAQIAYTRGLRQRNALLERAQETGIKNQKQFIYWNQILIDNGQTITKKRAELTSFINKSTKDIFDFTMLYDASIISQARLLQYAKEEIGAGVTLVGPHRDDFSILMFNNINNATHDVKFFGSRGQQRLVILQLKILEFLFLEQELGEWPILLLDDIFSELDNKHIHHILQLVDRQQTIITTTHQEFVSKPLLKKMGVIELS